jgi:hypothetical protein
MALSLIGSGGGDWRKNNPNLVSIHYPNGDHARDRVIVSSSGLADLSFLEIPWYRETRL